MTPQRRLLLETSISRFRALAAQERARLGNADAGLQYSSVALRAAVAHERSADALQAELDAATSAASAGEIEVL